MRYYGEMTWRERVARVFDVVLYGTAMAAALSLVLLFWGLVVFAAWTGVERLMR